MLFNSTLACRKLYPLVADVCTMLLPAFKILLLGCNNSLCSHMSGYNCAINFDCLLKRGSCFITSTKKYPCLRDFVVSAILTNKSWYEKFYIWIHNMSERKSKVLKLEFNISSLFRVLCLVTHGCSSGQAFFFFSSL